ncbi:MAG: class I SAM-dependent methyltransferase [Candidatus Heimdallarchaeota archaeon]|nr:class I SAM-dependent methyltransferase [Candidatus Heimdallarchaeota archaeon]
MERTIRGKTNDDHPNFSWSEKELPQKERTKHVHGLHPYLGKYVPQLVEYFLKNYFSKGDLVFDPFIGSGTTVVEANTLGINAIGADISAFNILLCKVKTANYDFKLLSKEIKDITKKVQKYIEPLKAKKTTKTLPEIFPSLEEKMQKKADRLLNNNDSEYITTWYTEESRRELLYFKELIPNYHYQDALRIILSRSARSARLAPHYELDWPKEPVTEPYHCRKHNRICYPTSGALKFLRRYGRDTIKRLKAFSKLKTNAQMRFIHGDSRTIDLEEQITGVMTSPPYVGVIDYHLQHQYAYEFLDLEDLRDQEIGPRAKGTSKKAKKEYVKGIQLVLNNCLRQLADQSNGPIIFVVNDKNKLYEAICQNIGLVIEE